MTVPEILQALEDLGNEQIKRIYMNHGAKEPFLGVKIGDMKTIVKKVKKNHALSLALYDTQIGDAMYLAGLIADEKKISKAELDHWVETATWYMHSEYTVPWVAAESPHGWELGLKWIESPKETVACSGWNAIGGWIAMHPDEEIDGSVISALLDRIATGIHDERNRVRYCMNGFLIGVATYYLPLADKALEVARKIGKVSVNLGDTACKVPYAPEYIQATLQKGNAGKKRKEVRC